MDQLVFRRAAEAESAAVFAILRAAFPAAADAGLERLRRLAFDEWHDLVVLAQDSRPVAVAHVEPHRLRVGACSVLKADIGHVAVRPDLQAQGLGTRLLQEIVAWLPQERFQISRLGGLMRFYQRFGYEPFPRRYVTLPVPARDAVLKGTPWSELLAVQAGIQAQVRPYDPAHDFHAVYRLRAAAALRPGALVLPTNPGPAPTTGPDPAKLVFVYLRDGRIEGYLRGGLARVHAGDPDLRYCLDELAVAPWDPEAVGTLVKTLLAKAVDRAPTEIMARLPYDEQLFAALTAAGLPFTVLEMRQALDGNMMQVVDLYSTLRAIAPELTRRLRAAGCCPWQGCLELRLPRLAADLRLTPDQVSAVPTGSAETVLELSHAAFIKALFGIQGLAEAAANVATLSGPQQVTAGILFPRLAAASGAWG
jgi:predicted N-acetyltransferase YhbS